MRPAQFAGKAEELGDDRIVMIALCQPFRGGWPVDKFLDQVLPFQIVGDQMGEGDVDLLQAVIGIDFQPCLVVIKLVVGAGLIVHDLQHPGLAVVIGQVRIAGLSLSQGAFDTQFSDDRGEIIHNFFHLMPLCRYCVSGFYPWIMPG